MATSDIDKMHEDTKEAEDRANQAAQDSAKAQKELADKMEEEAKEAQKVAQDAADAAKEAQ